MTPWWFDSNVAEPVDELFTLLPVGGEAQDRDLERCRKLSIGIDGLFRSEARAQYAGWPPESTTEWSESRPLRPHGHQLSRSHRRDVD